MGEDARRRPWRRGGRSGGAEAAERARRERSGARRWTRNVDAVAENVERAL